MFTNSQVESHYSVENKLKRFAVISPSRGQDGKAADR